MILVLGSNSFAGSALVDYLLSRGEAVIGVSRSAEPHPVLLTYFNNPQKNNFNFHQLDINNQFSDLEKLINSQKPNVIIDLAGQGMVAESWHKPEQWYMTNILAKVKLHDFLRQCDFLDKYIRISTPEVYGNVDHAILENQPCHPSTPYAVSHAATDMSLMAFYKRYDFPVVIGRFANFYGPHQQLFRIVPRAIIYALTQKKLLLHGGGTSQRAFIFHTDVANAIVKLITQGIAGEIYHFSGDEFLSIADLVRKITIFLGVNYDTFVEVVGDRPAKDNKYLLDDSKSQSLLEWRNEISLDVGLEKTIGWVKDNIDVIKKLPLDYIHKI